MPQRPAITIRFTNQQNLSESESLRYYSHDHLSSFGSFRTVSGSVYPVPIHFRRQGSENTSK